MPIDDFMRRIAIITNDRRRESKNEIARARSSTGECEKSCLDSSSYFLLPADKWVQIL
jgi:hypothetical protein